MRKIIEMGFTVVYPDRTRPSRIGVSGMNGQVTIYDAPLTNDTEAIAHMIAAAPAMYRESHAMLGLLRNAPFDGKCFYVSRSNLLALMQPLELAIESAICVRKMPG